MTGRRRRAAWGRRRRPCGVHAADAGRVRRVDARVGDATAGLRWVKRNVVVAMGNWLAAVEDPPEQPVAVLQDALEDEEPLVRERTRRRELRVRSRRHQSRRVPA